MASLSDEFNSRAYASGWEGVGVGGAVAERGESVNIRENWIEMQFSFGLTQLPFFGGKQKKSGLIFKFIGARASFADLGSGTARKVGVSGVGVAWRWHVT